MDQHRQLHLWITECDYWRLRDLAAERRETLSAVIRRMIKLHGNDAEKRPEVVFRVISSGS